MCCILLLVFAFLGQQRALHQRAARHRIILSTAIFDQQGLLLVHPDSGLLPSAKIYPSKQNEPEKFNVFQVLSSGNRMRLKASKLKLQRSDPAFVAFLKMSWNWRTLKTPNAGAGGAIAEDLTSGPGSVSRLGEEERDVGTTTRMSEADDEMTSSEAELMRRSVLSFEMAGEEIASELTGTPNLKALGVLYDSILKMCVALARPRPPELRLTRFSRYQRPLPGLEQDVGRPVHRDPGANARARAQAQEQRRTRGARRPRLRLRRARRRRARHVERLRRAE